KHREEQWAKIVPGSYVKYYIGPSSSLTLEVLSTSTEPFQFMSAKILGKEGKSNYKVGAIYTTKLLHEVYLDTLTGQELIRAL
ncbi:MAG: hypothetical protein Q8O55_04420, partial [Dehalococcoidales bacterium]|nr:hypothetical protein [Dehalococcoidales bacterium]